MDTKQSMKLARALSGFVHGTSDIKEVAEINLENVALQEFTKLASIATEFYHQHCDEITGWNANREWKVS